MKRSRWKLPFVLPFFFGSKIVKSKIVFINRRSICIVPKFINFKFIVPSGKVKKSVYVRKLMVGTKVGEYAVTKIFGSTISLSMGMKEQRKKEDKKRK